MALYDLPAEHWKHLRTTNLIESTFATIRSRHHKKKGIGNRKTSLVLMFKLVESASKRWHRLDGHMHLIDLLEGKKCVNGILLDAAQSIIPIHNI